MRYVGSVSVEQVGEFPVGVVRFTEPMEALSCAVLNGGHSVVSAAFIMQVPKNYCTEDPKADAHRVRVALGLPEDTLGMMTAAEVDFVFNFKETSFEGVDAGAFATAGLSNHVIAGEYLDDYEEKHAVSLRRAEMLYAGTINIGVVSSLPLTLEGKVNLFIPLVEAKSAAMAERGYAETGTTSDAMAVFSPIGEDRVAWTGTGSRLGIASARAVSAAVGDALARRDEHPILMSPYKILGKMGLGPEDLMAMSGSDMDPAEYLEKLDSVLSMPGVPEFMDAAWFVADRADSMAEDGDPRELELMLETLSGLIGIEPPAEGSLMDSVVCMIAIKTGVLDG